MSAARESLWQFFRPWPEPNGKGGYRSFQGRFFGVAITRFPSIASDGAAPVVFNVIVRLGRRKQLKVVYR